MIKVNNVSKTFNPRSHNANTVLENACLTLPDTGFVFIIGKSGIGKSTILNAIGGIMSYQGEILYDDKKVNIESYRKNNISFVFQDFLLFDNMSVRDNIRAALNINGVYDEHEITRRTNLLLKAVHLSINANRMASALSLGQKQRVAIARGLASNPKIILADEPTGNLDSTNSLNIMKLLKQLSKERLVLCVTHNVNLVNLFADKAYAIVNKTFQEVNPKNFELNSTYSEGEINIAKLEESDLETGNLLVKLYCDSSVTKQEIQIINRNGKILVVGNNISIASPNDVKLLNYSSAQKENKISQDKVLGKEELSEQESIDISFETTNEKPKFKDSAFVSYFFNFFNLKSKGSKVKRLFSFIEYVIPLVIFILCNSLFLVNKLTSTTIPDQFSNNQIVIIKNPENNLEYNDVFISEKDVYNMVNNPESHIIDYPSYFDNQNFYSATNKYSCYFEIQNQILEGKVPTSIHPVFADTSKYSTIAPFSSTLNKYKNLNDNEILIDISLLNTNSNNLSKLQCFNGKTVKDSIIGTYLNIHTLDYSDSSINNMYKIVGLVDFNSNTIFANTKTTNESRLKYLPFNSDVSHISGADASYLSTVNMPNFSGFTFLSEQDVINNPTKYQLNNDSSSSSSDVFLNGQPIAYISKGAKTIIHDNTISFGSYNILSVDYTKTVVDLADSNAKILCFKNYEKEKTINSKEQFSSSRLFNGLRRNSSTTIPGTLSLTSGTKTLTNYNDVIVPSIYLDMFGSIANANKALKNYSQFSFINSISGANNNEGTINIVGAYLSDNLSDTIYITKRGESYLMTSSPFRVNFASQTIYFNNYSSKKYYSTTSNVFLSDDPKATIEFVNDYLKTNAPSSAYESSTVNDFYNSIILARTDKSNKTFIITIAVLVGLMTLIMALDNISRINKNKLKIGILRCLGKNRMRILFEDSQIVFVNSLLVCLLPTIIILLFFVLFQIYFLSWWYLVFILGYVIVSLLASELPLLIVLSKKPIDIIHQIQ